MILVSAYLMVQSGDSVEVHKAWQALRQSNYVFFVSNCFMFQGGFKPGIGPNFVR